MKKIVPFFIGFIVYIIVYVTLMHFFLPDEDHSFIQAIISGVVGVLASYFFLKFLKKKQTHA
ncbi:MAG: hypothetical protein ACTHNW_22400 [Mucilaginibacter sp.]